jgi:16S rRNA (adenine1518-N6/adenine1519-N6)-dimethyltransferase
VRPKKKWGQNFLRNRGAARKIVEALEPRPDELILEIGPGNGALTDLLVAYPNGITVLEIDPELAAHLASRFEERVDVRNEDAVEAHLPDNPFRAVGNLPYNVGTPILRRVIAHPNCRRAVFMLQKEVADRLVAKPGTEPYGFLTLYREMFADAHVLLKLDPKSFYPPPKVRSAVVVLDPRPPAFLSDRESLLDMISTSFRMRRKKLVNNLIGWRNLDRDRVERALQEVGKSPDVRAETLSLADFDELYSALAPGS